MHQEVTVRRLLLTVVFVLSFLVGHPAPAHAWWHWLDELSGPGPFIGPELQWRLICFEENRATVSTDSLENPGTNVLRSLDSLKTIKADATTGQKTQHENFKSIGARALGLLGCPLQPEKHPVASINFRGALLWSTHNNLDYGGKPAPHVFIWQPEFSFSIFVDKGKHFEVMTAGGWSRTFGDGVAPLWRSYVKPVVLTFTPAPLDRSANSGWNRVNRALSVSASVLYMPTGYTAADFGAQGTYNTTSEKLAAVSIIFDLSRF
jgi:hypothetical protein